MVARDGAPDETAKRFQRGQGSRRAATAADPPVQLCQEGASTRVPHPGACVHPGTCAHLGCGPVSLRGQSPPELLGRRMPPRRCAPLLAPARPAGGRHPEPRGPVQHKTGGAHACAHARARTHVRARMCAGATCIGVLKECRHGAGEGLAPDAPLAPRKQRPLEARHGAARRRSRHEAAGSSRAPVSGSEQRRCATRPPPGARREAQGRRGRRGAVAPGTDRGLTAARRCARSRAASGRARAAAASSPPP